MKNKEMFDKYNGSLHGVAIGDALGYVVEFMDLDHIRAVYGKRGIREYEFNERDLPEGQYSDDTQMTLALNQALIDAKSEDIEEIMKHVSKRFLEWSVSPENNRAPGTTCMRGIGNLRQGMNWKESGLFSTGCGAMMRVSPIGLYFYDKPEKLVEIAKASAIIDHNHPVAIASAVGNAYAVARAVQGQDPTDLEAIVRFTEGISPVFTDKIKKIEKVLPYENTDKAIRELGEGWSGEETLAIALYCLAKNKMDFEESVIMGANTNGDSDSIASVCGGIAGAYHGYSKIPKRFLRGLENRKGLWQNAVQLYQKKFKDQ